jgi:hypothetical protein
MSPTLRIRVALFYPAAKLSLTAAFRPAVAQTPQERQQREVRKMTAAERDSLSRAQIRAAVEGRITRGIQDDMLRIEAVAPGFAGMYRGPDGELVAMLVDRGSEPQARAMLQQLIAHREPHKFNSLSTVKKIRFVDARFSLSELISWQEDLIRFAGRLPEFSAIGVRERDNAVSVSVTSEGARRRVMSIATARGIPAGGVVVEVGLPIRAL